MVFSAVSTGRSRLGEAVAEGDRERVDGGLPPCHPSCPAATGGVQRALPCSCQEVDQVAPSGVWVVCELPRAVQATVIGRYPYLDPAILKRCSRNLLSFSWKSTDLCKKSVRSCQRLSGPPAASCQVVNSPPASVVRNRWSRLSDSAAAAMLRGLAGKPGNPTRESVLGGPRERS